MKIENIAEFERQPLEGKINDLLIHYKQGHDAFYIEKAAIVKKELAGLELLRTRLASAEEALGFYASSRNWLYPGDDFHNFNIARHDISEAPFSDGKDRRRYEKCGGKRARAHFEKFKPIREPKCDILEGK
jgi:hypothetical protein